MECEKTVPVWPSEVHRVIDWSVRQLTPADLSLFAIADDAIRAGCQAYREFVVDMLSDMYDNPHAYALPAGELEAFLKGRKINAAKRKEPSRTKTLLSHMRNSVNGYITLLCLLGRRGVLNDGALDVTPDDMAAIAKVVKSTNSPIPLKTRLNALARVGLIEESEGHFVLTRHFGMFVGLCEMANRTPKMSSFEFFAFERCEFRVIADAYKPTIEDYFMPLCPKLKAVAVELARMAVEMKLRPQISTFWKVDYKYKGVHVMCLDTYMGELGVRINMTYGWDDPALANEKLAEESAEFQRAVLRHVWGCTACSTSHLGGFTTILGKRRRVCMGGGIGFRWSNPGEDDLAVIQKCLEIRKRIIDEIKIKK